jgi:hypothetical protein
MRQTKIICLSHLTAKIKQRKEIVDVVVDVVVALIEEVIGTNQVNIWMTRHKNRYKDEL